MALYFIGLRLLDIQMRISSKQLGMGILGTFLVVQWLGLWPSTTGIMHLIPGQGTKITHAAWYGKKKKKKARKKKLGVSSIGEKPKLKKINEEGKRT